MTNNNLISKDQSVILKGIAVLMMIFLHLFSKKWTGSYISLIDIGDRPLAELLTRAFHPVPFFLILGGYGIHYLYSKGNLSFFKQLSRCFKLYIYYWVVLLIFVTIGCFLVPQKYPGNIDEIIANVFNWKHTYNSETWFLFPYVMLSLTAVLIIKLINKAGIGISMIIVVVVYLLTTFLLSRYAGYVNARMLLFQPLVYFNLLFSFVLGIFLHRNGGNLWRYFAPLSGRLSLILIVILMMVRCTFSNMALDPLYSLLFILLFVKIKLSGKISSVFKIMGDSSKLMWMIHTFICYYLFHDFIYGFRYPVLIFTVLVLITYLISLPVDIVCRKIIGLLGYKNREKQIYLNS